MRNGHARILMVLGAALGVVLGIGCRAAPVAELSGYTAAFDQAKAAGEEMLLDHAAVTERAKRRQAEAEIDADPDSLFRLDVAAAATADHQVDHVGVRFRAWEIAEKYNEALVHFANGGRASEVEAKLKGFVSSVESFPLDGVGDVLDDIAPFSGLITMGLEFVERAIAEKNFAKALDDGAPLVSGFLELLIADAQNMYNARLGTFAMDRDAADFQLVELRFGFEGIAEGAPEDEVGEFLQAFNEALSSVRDWDAEELALLTPGDGRLSASQREQIRQSVEDAKRIAGEINDLDAEMLAYQKALVEYVRVLFATDRALTELAQAATGEGGTLPSVEMLTARAVQLKRAIALYKRGG